MDREHHMSFKKMNLIILIGGMGFFIAMVFRYLGWTLYPFMIRSQLRASILLNNGSEGMNALYEPQPGILKIYIFNITNPQEFSEGGIATVEEVGPYIYEQIKYKFDIELADDDTVSYRTEKKLYFNSSLSGTLSESDVVTVLNAPLLVMAYLYENEYPGDMSYFNLAIPYIMPEKQSLCIEVTVKDLLFDGIRISCRHERGHAKNICDEMKRNTIPSIRRIPDSEDLAFSYFYNYNSSRSKPYKIKRGNKKMIELGYIVEYDNKPYLSMWPNGSVCSLLEKTTDWEIFPPLQALKIHLFFPETCLSFFAHLIDQTESGDLSLDRYIMSDKNFHAEVDPCHCKKKQKGGTQTMSCTRKGVIDVERCTGEPFLVSFPHAFYSQYYRDVRGYKWPEISYETLFLIEPNSGIPLYMLKQLQTNILLRPLDEITILKNFSEAMIPMIPLVWFKELIEEGRRFSHADKINFLLRREMNLMTLCGIFVAFGILLLLVAYYMHSNPQKKKKIHPKMPPIAPIFELETRIRVDGLY